MSKTESIKANIISEAATLFSEQGYERTSMREIATRVGISKPAIYYHFTNKQTLFEELVNSSFQMSKKRISDITHVRCNPVQKLKMLVKEFFISTKDNPEQARFLYDLSAGNIRKDIKLNHRNVFSKHEALFNQILESGKQQGVFKKDLNNFTFIMIFIGTINMYMITYIKGEIDELNDKTADQIVDLLLNGIKK